MWVFGMDSPEGEAAVQAVMHRAKLRIMEVGYDEEQANLTCDELEMVDLVHRITPHVYRNIATVMTFLSVLAS